MATLELIINDRRRFHINGERRMHNHPIPPMTDPLSLYWKQPRRSLIAIDKTHALMSLNTFSQLCEYSASNPSGVYAGKMWRPFTLPGVDKISSADLWRNVWIHTGFFGEKIPEP